MGMVEGCMSSRNNVVEEKNKKNLLDVAESKNDNDKYKVIREQNMERKLLKYANINEKMSNFWFALQHCTLPQERSKMQRMYTRQNDRKLIYVLNHLSLSHSNINQNQNENQNQNQMQMLQLHHRLCRFYGVATLRHFLRIFNEQAPSVALNAILQDMAFKNKYFVQESALIKMKLSKGMQSKMFFQCSQDFFANIVIGINVGNCNEHQNVNNTESDSILDILKFYVLEMHFYMAQAQKKANRLLLLLDFKQRPINIELLEKLLVLNKQYLYDLIFQVLVVNWDHHNGVHADLTKWMKSDALFMQKINIFDQDYQQNIKKHIAPDDLHVKYGGFASKIRYMSATGFDHICDD